mmetsp:Transcript_23805/g.51335  ORF Transcript_23805/g.51335 Transcript_23805/m.51335 type:complete len:269 (-) Transcript_23805:588-1394(-)
MAAEKASLACVKLAMVKPETMHTIRGFCHCQRPDSWSASSSTKRSHPETRKRARSMSEMMSRRRSTKVEAQTAWSAPRGEDGRSSGAQRARRNMRKEKSLPRPTPKTMEMSVCPANIERTAAAEADSPLSGLATSASTSNCVSAKRRTTTTSMKTVTVSTVVVKGPLACSSSMMAMAEEGERATARHAMSKETAKREGKSRCATKGRKYEPSSSVETIETAYVTHVTPPRTHSVALRFCFTSLTCNFPPADMPIKPSASWLMNWRSSS